MAKKKKSLIVLVVLVVVFVGIQFIPVVKPNPPVTNQVVWNSPQTQEMFMGACADCHSNETVWPWYAKVAPVSWWINHHVEEGREHFNISEVPMGDADEAWEAVHEGWMPLDSYTWMHPKAQLTEEQRTVFSEGLKKTFNTAKPSSDSSHEEEEH